MEPTVIIARAKRESVEFRRVNNVRYQKERKELIIIAVTQSPYNEFNTNRRIFNLYLAEQRTTTGTQQMNKIKRKK